MKNAKSFSDLELRDVPEKGTGVFARRAFAAGAEVLEFLGDRKDVSAFADLTHALQIGPTTYLSPSGQVDDYVNHSCDPNTGVRDDAGRIVLFALKPIATGDEITFDYATTQAGHHWTITCACGSANCRGTIADFRDMPGDRQKFYIDHGAVLPFLVSGA
jgi:SET domain-containing protein